MIYLFRFAFISQNAMTGSEPAFCDAGSETLTAFHIKYREHQRQDDIEYCPAHH
jgi:hypothetical protein